MKRLAILALLIAAACSTSAPTTPPPVAGHGAVTIEVLPNPIVATPVSGNMYQFPFEVLVRETGGRAVTVQRVTATVQFGALTLARETYDTAQIRAMGHDPELAPHSQVRFRFNQKREVPDERLFSGVSAELRVDATDDAGTPINATTVVTVRR